MNVFTGRLIDENVINSSIRIEKTTLNIGSVTNYEKGFDVIRGMKIDDINSALWVGLDIRTEKKLAEIESERAYSNVRHLNILEKKEFQSFDDGDSGKEGGGIIENVLKKVIVYFENLLDKNVDMISFKEKTLRISEVDS